MPWASRSISPKIARAKVAHAKLAWGSASSPKFLAARRAASASFHENDVGGLIVPMTVSRLPPASRFLLAFSARGFNPSTRAARSLAMREGIFHDIGEYAE